MEQLKKMICRNQAGREIRDQFFVDGDVNIPEARRNAGMIIHSSAKVKIDEMKIVESYVKVGGKVQYQILYVSDDGEQRLGCMTGKLPFEEMVYAEEVPDGGVYLKSAMTDCRVSLIHSRKMGIRIMVEIVLGSDHQKEDMITADIEGETELYKNWNAVPVLTCGPIKKDVYRIKEEITIPRGREAVGNLLFNQIELGKLDTRLGTDALHLRGEVLVFAVYESVDGKLDWTDQKIPFEGTVECTGVEDSMYHQITTHLTDETMDVRMDEDGEMRVLGIEATLEIRMMVYEEETMEVLKDLYSLKKDISFDTEVIPVKQLMKQTATKYKLEERRKIPELGSQVLQICHAGGELEIQHTELVSQGIMVEGVLHLWFLYISGDGQLPFEAWQGEFPFTYTYEIGEVESSMDYELSVNLENVSVGFLGNGEIEMKAGIEIRLFLSDLYMINNITQIREKELDRAQMERAPGVVGYLVGETDTLWDLAKEYHTTVDSIKAANGIEGETLKPGGKILIFKGNVGIL